MKHAGPAALARLEPLLTRLRALGGLRENTPGAFYLRSRAFLHFHEDPAGDFADIRDGAEFERVSADGAAAQDALVERARRAIAGTPRR